DAAEATAAAIEHGRRGVYNVVDDEPAPVAEWLPVLADRLGAKPPLHVPRFVGRLAAGEAGVALMTEIRGASNAKARRELGWRSTSCARPASAASATSATGFPSRCSPTAATTPRSTRRWRTPCRWRCSCCWRACRPSSAPSCSCDVFDYGYAEIAGIVGKSED